ncbi:MULTISPECIES: PIN domain-containing protein [Janibacter]|uniref:PIN domain-containing protein n=1 Tax=Janibacter TaxID=53457 RepID=UPI0021A36771|nr:PIN domain-containing protein [Janibacter hoylei]MCT1619071.1 PIN domain-containing protein [Janibacter hoylei]
MYRVVLDTCTLVPGLQRDFLLQLATEGAYTPLWGTGILAELDYTLAALDARRGISGSESRRRRLMDQMRHAFPGAEVDSPKDRAYAYDVADPDDGHVAHAAIMGKADAIVTDDKRAGFTTATALIEAGIDTITPKVFAANTVAAHPQAGVAALKAMAGRRQNPVQSSPEILEQLVLRYEMHEVADLLNPIVEVH